MNEYLKSIEDEFDGKIDRAFFHPIMGYPEDYEFPDLIIVESPSGKKAWYRLDEEVSEDEYE